MNAKSLKWTKWEEHIVVTYFEIGGAKLCKEKGLNKISQSINCKAARLGLISPETQRRAKYYSNCGIPLQKIKHIKNKAKIRDIEYSVSDDYIWQLFLSQNNTCALSGEKIWFDKSKMSNTTASLDRIDSSKGYIEGNLQWVHKKYNAAKLNNSDEEYTRMCKNVYFHQSMVNKKDILYRGIDNDCDHDVYVSGYRPAPIDDL